VLAGPEHELYKELIQDKVEILGRDMMEWRAQNPLRVIKAASHLVKVITQAREKVYQSNEDKPFRLAALEVIRLNLEATRLQSAKLVEAMDSDEVKFEYKFDFSIEEGWLPKSKGLNVGSRLTREQITILYYTLHQKGGCIEFGLNKPLTHFIELAANVSHKQSRKILSALHSKTDGENHIAPKDFDKIAEFFQACSEYAKRLKPKS
jgi:hypothetical protein